MDQMCSDTIKLYYLDSTYMNIGSTYMPATDFFYRNFSRTVATLVKILFLVPIQLKMT